MPLGWMPFGLHVNNDHLVFMEVRGGIGLRIQGSRHVNCAKCCYRTVEQLFVLARVDVNSNSVAVLRQNASGSATRTR